jgi:SAM-dependent methyltransferase
MKPTITAREHYDRLAESGHGRDDPLLMQEYMARWDGPPFWDAVGDLSGKDVLEVGVGCGRIACQVLKRGCHSLTGIDISAKTIAAAKADLAEVANVELVLADIAEFARPESFDAVLSVLTFMHVEDKHTALRNVVDALRPGGRAVLSIDNASDLLDIGDWTVPLHPWPPERYAEVLTDTGCEVEQPIPLIDTWVGPNGSKSDTYGEAVATLIKAIKRWAPNKRLHQDALSRAGEPRRSAKGGKG